MPHLHTQAGQHDHTASGFIIRTDLGEPKVVVHLHKKLNMYLQFGGHVELHETHWQAVCHEIEEESGYSIDQLQLLQPLDRLIKSHGAVVHPTPAAHQTHRFVGLDHYHSDIAYAFITSEPPKHKPAVGESETIKLLSRDELAALTEEQMPNPVKDIFLFILDVCLKKWQPVPAAQIND